MTGDLDLVVGNININIPTLRIYYNTDGTLETTASWVPQVNGDSYTGYGIFAVDFDKDGWLDIAVSSGFTDNNKNCIFKNNNGTLERTPSWVSSDANPSGNGIFGDLNNDGFLDWAVNNGDYGVVYENIGGSINPTYIWSSNEAGGLGVDLGDVDRDGIVIKEDTSTGDGTRKLFYLSIIPIQRILEIKIDGVPVTDYTYHLKSGWVTFKNAPPSGSEIIFRYEYSIDLEFLLSDDPHDNAHLYRNNVVNVEERQLPRTSLKALLNVYPSVSKGELNISYFLPLQTRIEGWIYTTSGKKISKFLDGFQEPGSHKTVKTLSLNPGEYILKIRIGKQSLSKKIVILK